MAPNVRRKTHLGPILEVTPKTVLHVLCGRKFVGKRRTKGFRESLGNSGKNPSHPQKFACSYTYELLDWKFYCWQWDKPTRFSSKSAKMATLSV